MSFVNVFGERASRARFRQMVAARRNRQDLVAARLDRRQLMALGLLTSGGYLISRSGLSARAAAPIPTEQPGSPPTRSFIEPLPIMPIKRPVRALGPKPQVDPNKTAGEARTQPHQVFALFPPKVYYHIHQRIAPTKLSPDLPMQMLWGFDGVVPGPTYVARYGEPVLVRNVNELPDDNGGFGIPSVTTHLHNGHTPSESDGFPCDFFEHGHWYDQHYPNQLAGCLSTHQATGGDINEALSTLWYHDHRVDFTSQNVYKGLAGFYLLFNEFDTGDESTGFHFPSFPQFDIPMVLADKVFDEEGRLAFDLFNLDGILGDRYTVNGKIQPFFQVHPRRYRFRWLNVGPSRFYELFLTNRDDPRARNPFWLIDNDGNVRPAPLQIESVQIGVAERVDVIVDFSEFPAGTSLYLENRLKQIDGRGPLPPPDNILPPGTGNLLMRFDVVLPPISEGSQDPATILKYYDQPDATEPPRAIRTFKFDRLNGQWSINGQFMDCETTRFRVQKNSVEHWVLTNLSGDWTHPIHIHFEEHQIVSRNRIGPTPFDVCRKDVTRLRQDERVELFFRFRDFVGRYPLHCHNTVHEDHAMMLRWEITESGDAILVP